MNNDMNVFISFYSNVLIFNHYIDDLINTKNALSTFKKIILYVGLSFGSGVNAKLHKIPPYMQKLLFSIAIYERVKSVPFYFFSPF